MKVGWDPVKNNQIQIILPEIIAGYKLAILEKCRVRELKIYDFLYRWLWTSNISQALENYFAIYTSEERLHTLIFRVLRDRFNPSIFNSLLEASHRSPPETWISASAPVVEWGGVQRWCPGWPPSYPGSAGKPYKSGQINARSKSAKAHLSDRSWQRQKMQQLHWKQPAVLQVNIPHNLSRPAGI